MIPKSPWLLKRFVSCSRSVSPVVHLQPCSVILMLWLRLIEQLLSEISLVAMAEGGENWGKHMLTKFLLGCDTCHLDFTGWSKSHGNAWVQQVGDVQLSVREGACIGWTAMQYTQTASCLLCGTFASPELYFNLLLGVPAERNCSPTSWFGGEYQKEKDAQSPSP